jgi:predicted chitinase
MLDAKEKDLDSFEYKGKTYVKNTGKNNLVVYTEKSKFDKKKTKSKK